MASRDANSWGDKWAQRVSQSSDYYRQGVTNTKKSWAQGAKDAADRRNAGLIAAINSGAIDRGIDRAGDGKWRDATLSKGVTNWTQNTPKAKSKYVAAAQQNMNYMSAADAAVANMPKTTVQDRIARAGAWQLAMHQQAEAAKGNR